MNTVIQELFRKGYYNIHPINENRYIGLSNKGIKVYIKPTNNIEARALKELSNIPGIPQLLDTIISSIGTIIVVEYIEGNVIEDVIENNMLTFREKLNIAKQLLDIVLQIHQEGWVHGDINFTNIILDKDNKPYLIDFETSFKPEEGLPRIGVLYPPPESLIIDRNGYYRIDPSYRPDLKYDYWNLGLILFILFIGEDLPSASTFLLDEQPAFNIQEIYQPYLYRENLPFNVNVLISGLLCHEPAGRVMHIDSFY